MTWSRVLVPTDFSTESERAADTCLDLPDRPLLLLVHVGEPSPALEAEAGRLRALGATVEARAVARAERTIANTLLETAHEEAADLVAIGARGRGRALDRLLGSVSEAVLRRAETDVLVVRGRRTGPLFARVLVPTDLSPTSVEAAERLALTGAVGEGAMLHIGLVIPDGLEALASGLGWRTLNRPVPVVAGVIGAALDEEATVIALCRVGGADAVAGIPLGRVAEGVALAAPCPVLVAYPRAALALTGRELDSAEFRLATEIWRDYHGTSGDPAIDRIFALFADRTVAALARFRRHPDGCEVDAVFTPVPLRGRGYARRVVAGLVEACHNEDLYMYAVAGLEPFYAGFGFVEIPQTDLPPTIRARYDWAAGDMEAARVTPMRRPAGWYGGTTDTAVADPRPHQVARPTPETMADVSYVLPDTLPGEPAEREAFASRSGCDLVEVAVGDVPPPALPWLLRVASIDEDGRDLPRWHDRAWTTAFVATAAGPADRAPVAVLIEPGGEWSRPADLVRAIAAVRDGLLTRFGTAPAVLVANRAEQSLPDGVALAGFWDHLNRHAPDLAPYTGIALDAPEFYAATRTRMTAELALVPPEALRYVRLHTRGRKPDLGEPLPWRTVFSLVRRAPGTVLIAPAVNDPTALEPAILFCMVSLQGRAFT